MGAGLMYISETVFSNDTNYELKFIKCSKNVFYLEIRFNTKMDILTISPKTRIEMALQTLLEKECSSKRSRNAALSSTVCRPFATNIFCEDDWEAESWLNNRCAADDMTLEMAIQRFHHASEENEAPMECHRLRLWDFISKSHFLEFLTRSDF